MFCVFEESCVLEELGFFERHQQIPRRKSLPVVRLFFSTSLGEGVNNMVCVFEMVFGPNMTSTFFRFFGWPDDLSIVFEPAALLTS